MHLTELAMLPFGLAHAWSTLSTAVQKLSSFRLSMKVTQTNEEEISDDFAVPSETTANRNVSKWLSEALEPSIDQRATSSIHPVPMVR